MDSYQYSNRVNVVSKTNTPTWGHEIIGLTEYEINRKPRERILDDSTITLQIRTLNVELTCPVCLGILHKTMTVMECLHRFCEACINKSLRLGKKECPTCRVKVTSRRHLRPDPNFDGIIAAIYPNLDDFEAKEESMIEEINKSVMQSNAFKESIELGKRRQAYANKKKPPVIKPPPKPVSLGQVKRKLGSSPPLTDPRMKPSSDKATEGNKDEGESNTEENLYPNEIGFVLLVHPQEKSLQQLPYKYLRTSKLLTSRHLCKYLAKKFNRDHSHFQILSAGKDEVLEGTTTLAQIEEQWPEGQDLIIYYRLDHNAPNDPSRNTPIEYTTNNELDEKTEQNVTNTK